MEAFGGIVETHTHTQSLIFDFPVIVLIGRRQQLTVFPDENHAVWVKPTSMKRTELLLLLAERNKRTNSLKKP